MCLYQWFSNWVPWTPPGFHTGIQQAGVQSPNCISFVAVLYLPDTLELSDRLHLEKGAPQPERNLGTTSLPHLSPKKQILSEASSLSPRSKLPDIVYQRDSGRVGDDASLPL